MKTCDYIHIVVPGTPPSVNTYVRHGGGAHYKTPAAKRYYESAALLAREELTKQGHPRCLDREPLYEVAIVCWYGKKESGDIDNKAKIPLDALVAAGVIETDSRVKRITLTRERDWNNPRTEIFVQEFDEIRRPSWE